MHRFYYARLYIDWTVVYYWSDGLQVWSYAITIPKIIAIIPVKVKVTKKHKFPALNITKKNFLFFNTVPSIPLIATINIPKANVQKGLDKNFIDMKFYEIKTYTYYS